MKIYKLLKNVVNTHIERKPGYLWKALSVSIITAQFQKSKTDLRRVVENRTDALEPRKNFECMNPILVILLKTFF